MCVNKMGEMRRGLCANSTDPIAGKNRYSGQKKARIAEEAFQ